MDVLNESSVKDPETAVQVFLKRYYKQEDLDMKDLKSTAKIEFENLYETELEAPI